MTSFFSGQGFGGPPAKSRESQALSDINSRQKSFVNRDFTKNIAWLNNSVDMLSAYTQKLQKGVDEANQNTFEQIQAFAADLFVLFAGGEPTGIDIGDLKYVIQGIGAFLGINPDTPFPLNLFEAAWHMFETYLIPQQQFTDIIFDTVEAWAIDIGLSQSFIDAMNELRLAFEEIGVTFNEFFTSVWDLFLGLPDIDILGPFIDAIMELFSDIILPDLQPILVMLVDLGIPFIHALTEIVNDINNFLKMDSPLDALNLFNIVPPDLLGQLDISHVGTFRTNLITDPTFLDAESFSGNAVWFQDTLVPGHGSGWSARTSADGTSKELLGNLIPVSKDQVLPIEAYVKWNGLAGTGTPVQLAVTGYIPGGATNQAIIDQHSTTPATTDWIQLSGQYLVPPDVTSVRVRLVVTSTATAGSVWFSDLALTKVGELLQRLISGTNPGENLINDIEHLFTGISSNAAALVDKAEKEIVDAFMSLFGVDLNDVEDRINSWLDDLSPLNANNINQGNIADQFVPGLSTIHQAIVQAVGNITSVGSNIDKVLEVLTGQRNSVVSTSAASVALFSRLASAESRLAALPISLGGSGVGISFGGIVGCSDTDEFERVSTTSLGSGWLQYYSAGGGQWAIPNGHDAEYMWSGTSNREFICIRNNASQLRSLTDYQRVSQVLGSKGTRHYDTILGTYNYCGHNDVLLRISDSTTSLANMTLIRIRWGSDGSLSIVRFVNGVATTLKSYPTGYLPPPGPGSVLVGEAGDINSSSERYFRGLIGNSIAIEVTETGVASGVGPQFRRWGHGGRVEGWQQLIDNGQERPGTLNYWNGMDQVFR